MSDRLTRFTQPAAAPSAQPSAGAATSTPRQAPPEGRDYVAFDAQDKARVLRIKKPLLEATRTPDYAYLQDVVFDDALWENVALVYSFMIVQIDGRNLQPVTEALAGRHCAWIQQFSPKYHNPMPDDGKTPVITSIHFHLPGAAARREAGEPEAGANSSGTSARH